MISNKRRITIIVLSVFGGTILSVLMFKLRRGGELTANDKNALLTNFIFSIAIILGVGFMFLWNNKNNNKTGL